MTKTTGRQSWDEHVKRVVDEAPPLTNGQWDQLSLVLRERAVDNPATLARGAQIIRGAMNRSTPEAKKASRQATHPSVIRARKQGLA